MRLIGQFCLLSAFVCAGFAAFACLVGPRRGQRLLAKTGLVAAIASVAALTATIAILARALIIKDFSYRYVADYSSWLLVWYYSLSALWVGQAGSLLLWAWFLGILALAYYYVPRDRISAVRDSALGVLMAYMCFLVAIMVFGADPMQPSIVTPREGAGLGPLLHHPAMLIHPPIVFVGYAAWTIPFALAISTLIHGKIDSDWVQEARPWCVFAWGILGVGILLGASWAYEELGWGGYWGWDPVENGSLIPWLTGTAMIHALMAWRHVGVLKKTAMALAVATFGLCNFATFLTRSGIFSSVHAFSQSPIGWMFLVLMAALAIGGGWLIFRRRMALASDRRMRSVWSREAMVLGSALLLLLLASVAVAGTLTVPLSDLLVGRKITVGPDFYNNVLIPTGLLQLGAIALAPLLRWGRPPTGSQRMVLLASLALSVCAAALGFAFGLRHPIALAVTALAAVAIMTPLGALLLDSKRRPCDGPWLAVLNSLAGRRRQYAGFLIHLGFVCLAIGVTWSSLGTSRQELVLGEGERVEWAGRSIHYVELSQRDSPEKLVAEAVLEVVPRRGAAYTLRPARHFHRLPNQWTTEVAIHSAWSGDFYTILNSSEGGGQISLTLIDNPLMRWIWFGGVVMGVGAIAVLWPTRRRTGTSNLARPKLESGEERPWAKAA